MTKLNVTNSGWDWAGYYVLKNHPVYVAWGTLDELRKWAVDNGYEGILIGSPSERE